MGQRLLYRLHNPETIVPGKEIRIRVACPSNKFPEDVQQPKVEILTLTLEEANPERPGVFNQIFGHKGELHAAGLDLIVKRGSFTKIITGDCTHPHSFFFRCPRLPADKEARIGVRRNPPNPNKKQKIFGFDVIIDTSIEVTLGIELPVACSTIAGNAEEGKHYIANKEQILAYHGRTSKIDLGDVHSVKYSYLSLS